MSEYRVIKKYPNRRLYDTVISSYITLEDVRRLIMEQVAIKVIDAQDAKKILRIVHYCRLLLSRSLTGPSLFSTDSLQQLIRSYGGAMQQMLSKMFEQGVNLFSEQQQILKNKPPIMLQSASQKDPMQLMAEYSQQANATMATTATAMGQSLCYTNATDASKNAMQPSHKLLAQLTKRVKTSS